MNNVNTLAKFLVDKVSNIEMGTIISALTEYNSAQPLVFVSDAAKVAWVDAGTPKNVVPTGKGNKVTIMDVKRANTKNDGNNSSSETQSKEPSCWDSKQAKWLANKHGLTGDDFPSIRRTGRVLISGYVKVSLNDIKRKIGNCDILDETETETGKTGGRKMKYPNFSTQNVASYAEENSITPEDFPNFGKILKSDVDSKIKELLGTGELMEY